MACDLMWNLAKPTVSFPIYAKRAAVKTADGVIRLDFRVEYSYKLGKKLIKKNSLTLKMFTTMCDIDVLPLLSQTM